jgi:hypothetical protein
MSCVLAILCKMYDKCMKRTLNSIKGLVFCGYWQFFHIFKIECICNWGKNLFACLFFWGGGNPGSCTCEASGLPLSLFPKTRIIFKKDITPVD